MIYSPFVCRYFNEGSFFVSPPTSGGEMLYNSLLVYPQMQEIIFLRIILVNKIGEYFI